MIRCDVAIVGGGFTGAMTAAQLARNAPAGFAVTLFEPGELGRGAAYGTPHCEHVLNVRAKAMSAFPDDPYHFTRWLGSRATPEEFVSRRVYGDYIAEIARHTFERPRFTSVRDRVVAIVRNDGSGFTLETASRVAYEAGAVVLATGNPAPCDNIFPRSITAHPGYVGDPWRFDFKNVGGHVLLIGTGLTALDALVALDANGHRGAVYAVSRRGSFPEVHANGIAPYDVTPALETSDARALLRSFRRHVRDAAARGFDWRAVVDAIRPECETLWKRLEPDERRRFDRHLRPHWDRRRHRAPQQVDAARERYARSGRLFSYAGRVICGDGGTVTIGYADGGSTTIRPDWIVNCTGVGRARRLTADPLLAPMIAAGTIAPEPLGLGLRVDGNLAAIDPSGRPVDGLWVAGPLTRGSRFEAIAVPELRTMAQLVAAEILRVPAREVSLTG